jgi:hypothetical protein
MIVPNRVLACHHIELQEGCNWCKVYKQQSVRQCDRCGTLGKTDEVFLSNTKVKPELICFGCHYFETHGGDYENA